MRFMRGLRGATMACTLQLETYLEVAGHQADISKIALYLQMKRPACRRGPFK